jgi:hypothetical protein
VVDEQGDHNLGRPHRYDIGSGCADTHDEPDSILPCRHATPAEYRDAEDPNVYDDPLEQSGDEGERTLVTKALEEQATRLDALEARPPTPTEPEQPPLLWDRRQTPPEPEWGGHTIQGPYIQVGGTPDDRGRLPYWTGLASPGPSGDPIDAKSEAMWLWPATLTTEKPEPAGAEAISAEALERLRTRAAAEANRGEHEGYRRGFAAARAAARRVRGSRVCDVMFGAAVGGGAFLIAAMTPALAAFVGF